MPTVAEPHPEDPLDRASQSTRTLILAHAAPSVVAAVRAGQLTPSGVAGLIRDVMPRHRPSTCAECKAISG